MHYLLFFLFIPFFVKNNRRFIRHHDMKFGVHRLLLYRLTSHDGVLANGEYNKLDAHHVVHINLKVKSTKLKVLASLRAEHKSDVAYIVNFVALCTYAVGISSFSD